MKIKLKIFIISTCVLLLVTAAPNLCILAEGGLADTPWPTYGYDLQNTGQSPYVGPQEPTLKWAIDISSGTIYAQPVIGADGSIYFGACNPGAFFAINPDGTTKWTLEPAEDCYFETTAAIAEDGTIYVCMYLSDSSAGTLYALDPADGNIEWMFNVSTGMFNSPKIGADGTIYFADETTFFALNPDGTEKWSFDTDYCWPWYTSLAIGADGTIYLLVDYSLYAFNPDGTVEWSFEVDNYSSATAVGADGTIYIVLNADKLYAVNPDGTEKWVVDSDEFFFVAVGADDTVYTTGKMGVRAFSSDGVELWHFVLGEYDAPSPPVIGADGTLYFVATDDNKFVYALNPDGTEKWSYPTEYNNAGCPTIGSDGTLYAPSGNWPGSKLYAIEGPEVEETVSSSLNATANVVILMTGIEVDRDSVDYGELVSGRNSAVETIGITNTGTVQCNVTIEVEGADADAQNFYEQSLYIDENLYNIETVIASIAVEGTENVDTQLKVPASWADDLGTQEATFIFWAEES
ncbi:MAG: PQQ-binding-like beta-propeller repeat protein [Candidatus Bathyarchaeota archaeon]|nr:PQQ-binding-like beta-propeller repeat protein [Candidatus Bathyarchaeota archaeon]